MTDDTPLHRQIHPSFVQAGQVSSQAFRPTPKDEHQLSVYDGDQISAEKSWQHYTQELKRDSCGVLSVSVEECQRRGLPVNADPTTFAEHVLVDFSGLTNGQREKHSKALRDIAVRRDWQYQAGAAERSS